MTQASKQHSSASRFFLSNQSWRHLSKQGTFTGLLNINISCGVSLWLCSSPLAIFAHLCTSSLALLVPNSDRCPSRISNSLSTSPSQQVENVLPSVWRKMINAIQEALPLVKTLALADAWAGSWAAEACGGAAEALQKASWKRFWTKTSDFTTYPLAISLLFCHQMPSVISSDAQHQLSTKAQLNNVLWGLNCSRLFSQLLMAELRMPTSGWKSTCIISSSWANDRGQQKPLPDAITTVP